MVSESSENVVIPDMSESHTNETDNNESMISEDQKSVPVRVTAVDVEAVPVSTIPVGSLINVGTGETFNIVTSEQLQVRNIRNDDFRPTSLFAFLNNVC